mmetsp:Transcript_13335/g.40326  ORF Transcript_13335/g.40326 Transcript_13335/m.40326 type:complete len:542 (-) Transcript_13335:655-2280(-)|eukprot:CAMPEP_0206135580 /NCGR_PEP_ID=MMETSP1473-20131121/846_1 /ASSEMBLY_ACC=CAM_ASM_001109 /TAXON_ID=1461547 /ORGANISM="Stichococcus sp, Strain RCC1054" /LENGTH=541 /DNA_ID=CAMNT_0053527525 /DNA_START=177 /DNA_END=1802 /DNA_ORIENTATION=-
MQTTFRMPVEPDSQCLPIQISSYPESGEPPAGGLEAGSAVHIPRQGADVPHVQLPALASLSGGIKRLGGSAFSAFKPLASRQTQRPEHSNGTQVSLTLPASWVDRSGGSAASLHAEQFSKALAADTSSSSGASHRGGPSGGSDTPLPGGLLVQSTAASSGLDADRQGHGKSSLSLSILVGRPNCEDKLKTHTRTRYQEKNRKAQARFRERRKAEQAEKAARMADLEAKMAALLQENAELSVRTETLQQYLLQQTRGGSETGSVNIFDVSNSMELPANALLNSEGVASASAEMAGHSARNGPPREAYPSTWEAYTAWYQEAVQELAPLLQPAQEGNQAEQERIDFLWYEIVDVIYNCFLQEDESLRTKVQTEASISSPEAAARLALPTAALYGQVTAALRLTSNQVAHCTRVRKDFMTAINILLKQRQALNKVIEESVPQSCDANGEVVRAHSKVLEVFPLLQKNLEDERRMNSRLGLEFFKRIITPLQGAILCVGMWPYLPDKLAILTAATEPPAPDPLSASSIASRLPDAIDQATAAAAP